MSTGEEFFFESRRLIPIVPSTEMAVEIWGEFVILQDSLG
jgi:hypothetical protein